MRAVTSNRQDVDMVHWYLRQLFRDSISSLYTAAEKNLSPDDGAIALMLAYMTAKVCAELMSDEWKKRVSVLGPNCAEQIEKELAWTRTAREQLLDLAQEYSLRSSLNPGFITRSRIMAGLPSAADPIAGLGATVV